ncbi:alkaline phosphatase [Oxynema sp. CENA135]|nr:alkaline phosphatase [Oxynema sp. CENA135]
MAQCIPESLGSRPNSERNSASAKHVILFIGDGMGFEQVKAASLYDRGTPRSLSFQQFPHHGQVTTHSANNPVTDSAAAATAIATGFKVNNDVISMAMPGDGAPLTTVLEYFQDRGKMTGIVTTTEISHATPAAFAAHEPNRSNAAEIVADYFEQSRPHVLFGGGSSGLSPTLARQAGYLVVRDRAELQQLDTETVERVSGQFGDSHLPYEFDGLGDLPHLQEMTATAIAILDNDPDGFFLIVEGGRIDHAGHANDLQRNVMETLEFDDAVRQAVTWADDHPETLILVSADHETGGLKVVRDRGAGEFPEVTWSTTDHTGANVPIYGWGIGSESVAGTLDNTDFFALMTGVEPVRVSQHPRVTLAAIVPFYRPGIFETSGGRLRSKASANISIAR